jgi:hypothetical protein
MENPEVEMRRFYDYIGYDYFDKHDFVNVSQLTHENDVIHGIFGDHEIHPTIKPLMEDYTSILGFQNCDTIKQNYKWYFDKFNY